MREMIWNHWCDACYADGQLQQEATHIYTVGIVTGEEVRPGLKVLELCDMHDKLATDMQALLAEVGQVPDFKAAMEARKGRPIDNIARRVGMKDFVECPVCRQNIVKSSLITHVWGLHRRGDERPAHGTICPECRARYTTGQGMAAHRRAEHGFDSLAEALKGAHL